MITIFTTTDNHRGFVCTRRFVLFEIFGRDRSTFPTMTHVPHNQIRTRNVEICQRRRACAWQTTPAWWTTRGDWWRFFPLTKSFSIVVLVNSRTWPRRRNAIGTIRYTRPLHRVHPVPPTEIGVHAAWLDGVSVRFRGRLI